MNPLLSDIPEEQQREFAPLLPLVWWMAGAQMQDAQRRRGRGGTAAPEAGLRDEVATMEEATRDGRPDAETTIRLRVPMPSESPSMLQLLSEKLSLRDDVWLSVAPWRQVTAYRYGRNWCLLRPFPKRLEIRHREEIERTEVNVRVAAKGTTCLRPQRELEFHRKPRGPWSRREDAANLLSDLWVETRLGLSAAASPQLVSRLSERLAQLNTFSSELWDNHSAMGCRAISVESSQGAPEELPLAVAEVMVDAALPQSKLPKVVRPDLVLHAMEKVFVAKRGMRLILRVEARAPTYQEAERRLWACLRGDGGGGGGLSSCVRDSSSGDVVTLAVLEYSASGSSMVQSEAPLMSPGPQRFALTHALEAVGLMVSLGLLEATQPVMLGCASEACRQRAARVWASSFLSRPVHTSAEVAPVVVQQMLDHLEQATSRADGEPTDVLLHHWGILWERERHGADSTSGLRECPTSGSMPRLYKPGTRAGARSSFAALGAPTNVGAALQACRRPASKKPEPSAGFVVRPKLFSVANA